MMQYILWAISFFTLWITIVWISYISFSNDIKKPKRFPSLTIAIPTYNEEKTLARTVNSVVKANYPKEKLKILIVNDGSKDKTKQVALDLIKKHKNFNIRLLNKKNGGKASANNLALENANTELFAVLDADSRISKNSISLLVSHFEDKNLGAAISRIKIDSPKNIIEKVQRFEYIMSALLRKLMSVLGTLSMTPGVLSIYRTSIIKKLGGFTKERDNLTEDLEIAMRLKYKGYGIVMEHNSITYTNPPSTFKALWRQRIRWSRGYIFNHWKYKDMFFSKKHGLFGVFQLPVNAMAIFLLAVNIIIISTMLLGDMFEFFVRSFTIDGYLISWLTDFPTLKEFALGINTHIMLPIVLASALGFYMVYKAHKQFKEKIARHIMPIVVYFIVIPYFLTANWLSSIIKELLKFKRSW